METLFSIIRPETQGQLVQATSDALVRAGWKMTGPGMQWISPEAPGQMYPLNALFMNEFGAIVPQTQPLG